MEPVKTRFYVDALNFYYQIARVYNIKWIDMAKLLLSLVQTRIPNAVVEKIYIFTGKISSPESSRQRQAQYLGALMQHSHPQIEVIFGKFKPATKQGILIDVKNDPEINAILAARKAAGEPPPIGTLVMPEEKQTDVNMGGKVGEDIHAKEGTFDVACLVSNDGDLAYPLKLKRQYNQRILLIAPIPEARKGEKPRRPTQELTNYIPDKKDIISPIPLQLVRDCQLPREVGQFTRPAEWDVPE